MSGFAPLIGDATTTGTLAKARYIDATPQADASPDIDTTTHARRGATFISATAGLKNSAIITSNPNNSEKKVAVIGGA